MNATDLITQEPFNTIFRIDESVLLEITAAMRGDGFDPAFPIITWNGIVIDGHTRLQAAKDAGITDVPVVEKDFSDEEDALDYAIACQQNRRNLTDAEIVRLVNELDKRRQRGGDHGNQHTGGKSATCAIGKSATETAKKLHISTRKVEQVRTVLDKATPEVKAAVESGAMGINAAVKTVTGKAGKPSPSVQDGAADAVTLPVDTEGTDHKAEIKKPRPVENAHDYARFAILQLDRIEEDDPTAKKEMENVKRHINNKLSEWFGVREVIRIGKNTGEFLSDGKRLKADWKAANKTDREKFLSWVDKERSKDLPKSNYLDARKVAVKLRRMLKTMNAGDVNSVMQELDLGGGESWLK